MYCEEEMEMNSTSTLDIFFDMIKRATSLMHVDSCLSL